MEKTPNRFANGCKSENRFTGGCTCNTTTKKQTSENVQCIKDIRWYPDKCTLVIEKNNHNDLVVNLNEIIPDEPKLKKNINVIVWNPVTNQYDNVDIANKDEEYTTAIQKISTSLSSPMSNVFYNNVCKVIDEKMVWAEWKDKN